MSIILIASCVLITVVGAIAAGVYVWMTDREQ